MNIVSKVVRTVQPKISRRKKCFELLGFDLMVDASYHLWLLEVNTSPAMDYSTVKTSQAVTETLVKQVLRDTLALVFSGDSSNFWTVSL